ncbi:MAG: preprotein translocase subunit SecA, partial [Acinetobacter sp.]
MTEQEIQQESSQSTINKKGIRQHIRHDTAGWKLFLAYDIFMMFIIVFNLFCLCANAFLMSNFGNWFFESIHLPQVLQYYKNALHPWVIKTESWFIT